MSGSTKVKFEDEKKGRNRAPSRGSSKDFFSLSKKKHHSSSPSSHSSHSGEDDLSEELLKRLRETQRQLAAAKERNEVLESNLSHFKDRQKANLAEIKRLNKVLSVSENTKFGNENKKELRSKLLMCQEELKEIQQTSQSRVNQLTVLLKESELRAQTAADTAARSLQQLQMYSEIEEGDFEGDEIKAEYARECLAVNELQTELAACRQRLAELDAILHDKDDNQFQNERLHQKSIQIAKASLAVFHTAQKEGVKFSPLLIGLVEQLQAVIQVTDEGRGARTNLDLLSPRSPSVAPTPSPRSSYPRSHSPAPPSPSALLPPPLSPSTFSPPSPSLLSPSSPATPSRSTLSVPEKDWSEDSDRIIEPNQLREEYYGDLARRVSVSGGGSGRGSGRGSGSGSTRGSGVDSDNCEWDQDYSPDSRDDDTTSSTLLTPVQTHLPPPFPFPASPLGRERVVGEGEREEIPRGMPMKRRSKSRGNVEEKGRFEEEEQEVMEGGYFHDGEGRESIPRSLSFPKGYYGYNEVLEVMVYEARGLPWFEVDPFVACHLIESGPPESQVENNFSLRTPTLSACQYGGEFGWNEVFVFSLDPDLEDRSLLLSLEMFSDTDPEKKGEEYLGSVTLNISSASFEPHFSWYSLNPPQEEEEEGEEGEEREKAKKKSKFKGIDLHISFRVVRADLMVCSQPWFGTRNSGPLSQPKSGQGRWEKKGGATREIGQGAEGKLGERYFGGVSETVETMLEVLTSSRGERGELLLHGSDLLKATPLELAASKERPNLSSLVTLLQSSIEDTSFNPHFEVEGRTYLHLMAECGSVRLCKRLIQLGCRVRQVDDMGFAPVHVAAAGGHPMCLKLLLDEDESMINLVDEETNSTPLHYASLYGRSRCVSLLLDRGARIDKLDNCGATAAIKAAYNGHKSVLRIFGKIAKLHLQDKESNNAFLLSCLQGHFLCATTLKKYLPRSEVSSSHQNNRGDTAIWGTFLNNNFDYLKILLEDENPGGKKSFFEDTVKKMVGSHTMGPFQFHLLHRCLLHLNDKQHCYKMVRYLLSCGADPNARTTDQKTPLFIASFQNRVSCIPLLLNHGADVGAIDEDGNTALHFIRHVDIAAKILATLEDSDSRREYCNIQNNQGNGALHVAFSRSDYDMATFLLTHGADPNLQNLNGNRPEECIWSRDVIFDVPYLEKVEGGGIFMSPVNFSQNYQ